MFWFYLAMNNAPLNINSIRQPAPNAQNTTNNQTERQYNLPNVGVVSPPAISRTPMADTMTLKKQENPRMAYKLTPKSIKGFKLQNIFSLAIAGCSIGALLKLLKKK